MPEETPQTQFEGAVAGYYLSHYFPTYFLADLQDLWGWLFPKPITAPAPHAWWWADIQPFLVGRANALTTAPFSTEAEFLVWAKAEIDAAGEEFGFNPWGTIGVASYPGSPLGGGNEA